MKSMNRFIIYSILILIYIRYIFVIYYSLYIRFIIFDQFDQIIVYAFEIIFKFFKKLDFLMINK